MDALKAEAKKFGIKLSKTIHGKRKALTRLELQKQLNKEKSRILDEYLKSSGKFFSACKVLLDKARSLNQNHIRTPNKKKVTPRASPKKVSPRASPKKVSRPPPPPPPPPPFLRKRTTPPKKKSQSPPKGMGAVINELKKKVARIN